MSLIKEQDAQEIRQHLAASITRPVQLALFVSAQNCEYCALTRELAEALCALHADLTLAVYDLQADAERAALLGSTKLRRWWCWAVRRTPTTACASTVSQAATSLPRCSKRFGWSAATASSCSRPHARFWRS